jgi:class 3 adenylate cyclase
LLQNRQTSRGKETRFGGSTSRRQTQTAKAERRLLAILFCDLVGSTALAETLDAEELHEIVARYQTTATVVIEKFGGRVAQYLGMGY